LSVDISALEVAPIVASRAKGGRILPREADLPRVASVRIEIPEDVQLVKRKSMELGVKWRAATRRAFLWYLGRGYRVTGFYRDPGSARCFYLVSAERGGK